MTSKEFFDKLVNDAELGGKIAAAKTPEDCYAAAKAAGLTDSMDAFMAVAKEMNAAASKLDPSEADAVVGGGKTTTTTTTTTTAVPAASSAIV